MITKESLLYIDDEIENLITFEMVFEHLYEVVKASNAEEAWKVLESRDIKVIMMDQMMPDIKGLDLWNEIRVDYPNIVCVMLTSSVDPGVAYQAVNTEGIYRFMLKPWDVEEMTIALRNAFDKYDLTYSNTELLCSLKKSNNELQSSNRELIIKTDALKHREQNLIRIRNNLVTIIDNSPDSLFLVDQKLEIVKVNKSSFNNFNIRSELVIGNKVGEAIGCVNSLSGGQGCDSSECRKDCKLNLLLRQTVETRVPINKQEYTLKVLRDGELVTVTVLLSTALLNYDDEELVLLTINDITDRKNLEDSLRASKEKAEESDRLKTAFLANISHEIRTPMNGIIGFSEMLRNGDLDSSDIDNYAGIIIDNSCNLLHIVNDILDVSKIDAGQIELHNSEFDLSIMANNLFNIFKSEVEDKMINFSIDISLDGLESRVFGDQSRIGQIISYLLQNALKFTHSGSIDFKVEVVLNKVRFCIKDTGIGISQEMQSRIFQRFQQIDSSNDRLYGGTGLGLSIARDLAILMGGDVTVSSTPLIGSEFEFYFPYNPVNNPAAGKGKESQIRLIDSHLNALIIEDEIENYWYLERLLKKRGGTVYYAKNGLEGIDLFLKLHGLDVIFLEMNMHVMNGYEVIKHLKEQNLSVPIVGYSNGDLGSERKKAKKAGFDHLLSMPFNNDEFDNLLSPLINKNGQLSFVK